MSKMFYQPEGDQKELEKKLMSKRYLVTLRMSKMEYEQDKEWILEHLVAKDVYEDETLTKKDTSLSSSLREITNFVRKKSSEKSTQEQINSLNEKIASCWGITQREIGRMHIRIGDYSWRFNGNNEWAIDEIDKLKKEMKELKKEIKKLKENKK